MNDDVMITTYAPVFICTLNRYEHLKRLLESLERNPLAQYTEIFISVDFPPSEKYVSGHGKIVKYLKNSKFGFKETNLFFQESNLGVLGNYYFLEKLVFEKFDRAINFEDDNEASVNFLEYMNKALEYGKNRDNIAMVTGFSGYHILPENVSGTAFKDQDSNWWGAGIWRDKEQLLKENITNEWVDDIAGDWKKLFKVYLRNKIIFVNFFDSFVFKRDSRFCENGKIRLCDTVRGLDNIFNDKYVIIPTISKVRNWGCDGTGVNSVLSEKQMNFAQPLDEDEHYKFIMEDNDLTCKKIQHYARNKRMFSYSEMYALKTFLYCLYILAVRKIKAKWRV